MRTSAWQPSLLALKAKAHGYVRTSEVNLLQSFYQQLSQNGYTFDQYLDTMKISSEQFKQDMKQQAEDTVRQDMALDAWARHNKIEATAEEVSAEFQKANVDDPWLLRLNGR